MTLRCKSLLALLLMLSGRLAAQNTGSISSSVLNDSNEPLPDAIITLFRAADTVVLKTQISDAQGSFVFRELPATGYFITAEKESFEPHHSSILRLTESEPELRAGPIVLRASTVKAIDGVTVKATTPFVQKKVDRTIVNPDALISNAGLTALDVLGKAPGVRVDAEGLISLLSRPGVVIFIDDRPSNLSAADLASYLRTLPASSIQSFEIMTNPPAKYDAAGNAGIINIRMKKITQRGFNGSANLSYGQGIYHRLNGGVVFNYRINKLNFFSNISYSHNNVFQDLRVKRRYFSLDGSLSSVFDQHTFIRREPKGVNYRGGVDYYLSPKSTLGIVVNGFQNVDMRNSDNVAQLFDSANVLTNTVITGNPAERRFRNISVNANYTYKTDDRGGELSANADVLRYNSRLDQSLPSRTYLSDGSFAGSSNLVSTLPAEIAINTAKLDYIRPVGKGRFEAGAKASFINTENIANFFDERNGVLSINDDFTNSFAYDERIQAGYLNLNQDWGRLSAQIGLRYERTAITGRQYGSRTSPDSTFNREFNNLFPTVYLQYKPDSAGNHRISFSFGRRIDRPDYQSMNPFTYPIDRFTIYSGNPFLQPTFSNNFELAYNYRDFLNTALVFGYVRDVISETISQGSNTFYSKPGNIGRQISYGVTADFGKPLTKWWTLQLHTEVMHNTNLATLYGQELDNRRTYWYIGPTNQITLPKGWSAELSGSYISRVASGQFIVIAVGSVNMAVAKKMLTDRLTVKLALNDVFYTNRPGGEILGLGNSTASWRSRLDTRVGTLSLNYRLSRGKNPGPRTTGAADDEKSRVR